MNIYVITNLKNNKQYIGREKVYKKEYYGSGKLIKEAIKKYGKQNFRKEILIDDIDDWEECSELEAVCKLSLNTVIPNGYNKTCWEYPLTLEILQRGGKIAGEQNKKLKRGICNSENFGKGGKISGKKTYELKIGVFAPGMQSKGGKKAWELKRGLFDPKYFGKGAKRCKELGVGFYDSRIQSMGGKLSALALFELDEIFQQMTLGKLLRL